MSASLENTRKFLESLQRGDLSKLLAHSEVESRSDDWVGASVIVRSPRPYAEAIAALPPHDRKRIAEAVVSDEGSIPAPQDINCETMDGPAIEGLQALLPELILHQAMMIDVGTGLTRIADVNDYYIARQDRIITLCNAAGIVYSNAHSDLWHWYEYYKDRLTSYSGRRQYIRTLFGPTIKAISGRALAGSAEREPTGWERVDRTIVRARALLGAASAEEDFQAVGLLCREVMISLAQAVYDPAIHVPEDGVSPSPTDANRMLEAYLLHVFSGASYKEVRAHARAALALALNVQHRRTATRQLAELCLEAATSVTAVLAIISGRSG